MLAGVGTSWYTWLEQGRVINISEPVARAISRALRLIGFEREYFYRLVGLNPQLADPGDQEKPAHPSLRKLVDEWLPSPALVLDKMWNIVAINHATQAVFGLSKIDRNLMESLVTNRTVTTRFPNYDQMIRTATAQFRASTVDHCDDPFFRELVDDLCHRDSRFARLWRSHDVADLGSRHKEVRHPLVGTLAFETQLWRPAASDSIQLVLHLPRPTTDSSQKLRTLLSLEQADQLLSLEQLDHQPA